MKNKLSDPNKLSDLIDIANKVGYDSVEFRKAFENYVEDHGYESTPKGIRPKGDQTNGKRLGRRGRSIIPPSLPDPDDV